MADDPSEPGAAVEQVESVDSIDERVQVSPARLLPADDDVKPDE